MLLEILVHLLNGRNLHHHQKYWQHYNRLLTLVQYQYQGENTKEEATSWKKPPPPPEVLAALQEAGTSPEKGTPPLGKIMADSREDSKGSWKKRMNPVKNAVQKVGAELSSSTKDFRNKLTEKSDSDKSSPTSTHMNSSSHALVLNELSNKRLKSVPAVPERANSPMLPRKTEEEKNVPKKIQPTLPSGQKPEYRVAKWDVTADEPDELTFKKGDKIRVISKDPSGWWTGELPNGKTGTFPYNYTQPDGPRPLPSHSTSPNPGLTRTNSTPGGMNVNRNSTSNLPPSGHQAQNPTRGRGGPKFGTMKEKSPNSKPGDVGRDVSPNRGRGGSRRGGRPVSVSGTHAGRGGSTRGGMNDKSGRGRPLPTPQ